MTDPRIPAILLTGFLGSGKTTLLNHLLGDPALADSVVIVNEFGDIPLDHLLITHVDENIRLLDTGCVCCAVRGDLVDTLADLEVRRGRGELSFERAFIETSGLVDPAPIYHSFAVDPLLTGSWRLRGVVTTVDAINGPATLERHAEARRQVALADVILVTKQDIAEAALVEQAASAAKRLNPHAAFASVGDPDLAAFLARDGRHELGQEPVTHSEGDPDHDHVHRSTIQSRSLYLDEPVPQALILQWIELLATLRGERLLRLKALIRTVEDPDHPILVQAVQHVVHPVQTLARWPDDERRSRIVIIGEDLDFDVVERTFRRHLTERRAIGPVT